MFPAPGCAAPSQPWPPSPAACWPGQPSRPPPPRPYRSRARATACGPATPGGTAQVITAGGMPGWQITLIAVAAALAAATAAVFLDRARTSRRPASATG
jgi:hypothetical protein